MTIDRGSSGTNVSGATTTSIEDLDFVASRVFDAPRELVFQAFGDCRHLTQWFGPAGWTLPVCEMDFRTGGTWFYCMQSPDGELACGTATYHEIVEPERIVYTNAFAGRDRKQIPDMPEMLVTITFAEANGGTTLTSTTHFASAKDLEFTAGMGMVEGLIETWDRLEAYLATG